MRRASNSPWFGGRKKARCGSQGEAADISTSGPLSPQALVTIVALSPFAFKARRLMTAPAESGRCHSSLVTFPARWPRRPRPTS